MSVNILIFRVIVLTVPRDEEYVIAQEGLKLLGAGG